jgi:hypothetical protein
MKQLQKPLVLFAWNVFVLWGVGKLYGYRWLLSVLLGMLALTVFASWMFVNVVLYDAIKALWCALRQLTLKSQTPNPNPMVQ